MSLLLDRRLISVAEYHKMAEVGILQEKGIELIRGEIINRSPIGSEHASCVNYLTFLLNQALGEKCIVSIQNPIQIGQLSEPEPDIALLKPEARRYRDHHPQAEDVLVVIEVADSSLTYDKGIKTKLYAEAGIPEYVLVNLVKKTTEEYREPSPQGYTRQEELKSGEELYLKTIDTRLKTSDLWE